MKSQSNLPNSLNQLKANVQQQTKRLICQLQQLDCEELDQEQKQELKKSTLQQLQIFQQSLDNMLKDPNNSLLESDIEKTKRLIYEQVKQRFNKEEIKGKILNHQVNGLRNEVKQLEKAFRMKQIQQKQYVKKVRNIIVEIQESGAELTSEEHDWLKGHEGFQQAIEGQEKLDNVNQMKKAQEEIKKHS